MFHWMRQDAVADIVSDAVRIPSLINEITIKFPKDFKLRAIIVTEHRNLDFAAAELSPHTKDVLFVQGEYSKTFIGPTFADLHISIGQFAPVRRTQRLAANPRMTSEEATADETRWTATMHAEVDRNMTAKTISDDDRQLCHGYVLIGFDILS
ncbi:MAG: hypothetical protein Q9195_005231 [Heterodermia aff. obscurata]